MITYGLIGFPLSHSFSKKYFNQKFIENKIKAHYKNFEIEIISELQKIVENELYLKGLNVTSPHKQSIIPYLSEIEEHAQKIGAVNTIKITKDKELIGYNTDYIGFLNTIKNLIKTGCCNALVLGTGGASQAICYALNQLNITYKKVSRKNEEFILYSQLTKEIIKEHKLIINTTPIGTYPNTDVCPNIPYIGITNEHICYDLVYNPKESLFLKKSKDKGAKIISGYQMLIEQAEQSWKIWNL